MLSEDAPPKPMPVTQYIQVQDTTTILPAPVPFSSESDENKLKILLMWLLPKNQYESVLYGGSIQNVKMHLENMNFNGYLRIFEADFNLLREKMSLTSWKLFLDFEQKRKNDKWICPTCANFFDDAIERWKCARCLFYFHDKCSQSQTKRILICFKCFFGMQ